MSDDELLTDLLVEWEERSGRGESVDLDRLCAGRPDLVPALAERIDRLRQVAWLGEPAPPPPSDGYAIKIGPLAGRYRLDSLIGAGGFGLVWRGFDLHLERDVAVKVPRPGREWIGAAGFLAEGRKVARLRHPGIVTVYDIDQDGGTPFIVTELVDGSDLAGRLRNGPLPVREAVRIVAEAARSLDFAHRQGVIHRDVKLSNVLVGWDGRVQITDFGIAVTGARQYPDWIPQTVTAPAGDTARIDDGWGTIAYMAPERFGDDPSRIDARTDVYSLGVVLYELLTGRRPFEGPNPAHVREAILHHTPVPPGSFNRAIPPRLDRVVLRCLAKKPSDRYPTAKALADAITPATLLAEWVDVLSARVRRCSPLRVAPPWRWVRSHRTARPSRLSPPRPAAAVRKWVRPHLTPRTVVTALVVVAVGCGYWVYGFMCPFVLVVVGVMFGYVAYGLRYAERAEAAGESHRAGRKTAMRPSTPPPPQSRFDPVGYGLGLFFRILMGVWCLLAIVGWVVGLVRSGDRDRQEWVPGRDFATPLPTVVRPTGRDRSPTPWPPAGARPTHPAQHRSAP